MPTPNGGAQPAPVITTPKLPPAHLFTPEHEAALDARHEETAILVGKTFSIAFRRPTGSEFRRFKVESGSDNRQTKACAQEQLGRSCCVAVNDRGTVVLGLDEESDKRVRLALDALLERRAGILDGDSASLVFKRLLNEEATAQGEF